MTAEYQGQMLKYFAKVSYKLREGLTHASSESGTRDSATQIVMMWVLVLFMMCGFSAWSFPSLFPCENDLAAGTEIMGNPAIQVEFSERSIVVDRSDDEIAIGNSTSYTSRELFKVYLSETGEGNEHFLFEVNTSGDGNCRAFPAKFINGECEGKRKVGDSSTSSLPIVLEMPDSPTCDVAVIAAYGTGYDEPVKITRPLLLGTGVS